MSLVALSGSLLQPLVQAVWPSLELGTELLPVPGVGTMAVPHLGLERPLQVGSVTLGLQ